MKSKKNKEIIIVSEDDDKSTNLVIEWLHAYGKSFKRYNDDSFFDLSIFLNKDLKNVLKKYSNNVFWIRRGGLKFSPNLISETFFYNHIKTEEKAVKYFFEKMLYLNRKIYGSSYFEKENNKINNLFLARESGLKIPDTLITTSKKELNLFFNKYDSIINKCIFHPIRFNIDENYKIQGSGTVIVAKENIDFFDDFFSLSFFQEYIEKQYEVRIFFLKDFFFSMAIFSQNDEKTKIDYRNYNREKSNRNIPFELPRKIKNKIKKFIKKSKIDTGSIDLVVNNKNDFFFLEINPQGQFNWVSETCNYYIEKKIAEEL
ncbi:hypothetical protein FIA58_011680 [Flavobacterium jejuense]|uniref:ATP-grasp domain-containing protein n=1 Tax=Flavobacterium jejuense TaxID=1544455 RepID=A0ABX0IX36_9FLAO|nr:hypothetical protein [Flavobacterium jejuense]NHN26340.1 hypothetical protein [Flavobacterium jejuense]